MQKIMFKGYQWIRKSDVALLCLITKEDNKLFPIGELLRFNDKWAWVSLTNYNWVPVSIDLNITELNIAKLVALDMVIRNIEDCFEVERKKTATLLNVFNRGEF